MQLHSSQRQESALTAAPLLTVVNKTESTAAQEPYRLHAVTARVQYTTSDISYRPTRRYTIDDNGGSYEGL